MRFDFANLKNDRGNIGVLMALVLFTVVGSLCMTWNTAQLSKEKMRLQNAADSAALGFCTWQARGMNAVQNINDEMYMSLGMATSLQKVTIGLEATAKAFDLAALNPFTAWLKGFAIAFHSMGVLCGGTSGLIATKVVPWVLVPAGYFYAYGSCALGYLSAQQLAADNRADPVGLVNVKLPGGFGDLGLYALGFAYPFMDTLKLPLEQKEIKKEPWKCDPGLASTLKALCKTSGGLWSNIYNICGTGEKWEYKPWISPKDSKGAPRRPGPAVFVTYKVGKHIERISLDSWKKDFSSSGVRNMPMFAIAAAQCITGDVIEASKDPVKGYPRGRGHGTGATAKLVTVAYAIGQLNSTFGNIIGAAIYH